MRLPHAEPIRALLARLDVDPVVGLTSLHAAERLRSCGPNLLPEPPERGLLSRLVGQLLNPLVLTLLAAAFIAVGLGISAGGNAAFLSRFGDAIAIFLIVFLNAVLGLTQERRAEAALQALKKISSPSAKVVREGRVQVVESRDVVAGDILSVEAGDWVAADARLLETVDVAADEASLTGESEPSRKDAGQPLADDAVLAERATMIFLGTTLVRGRARAVVVATGSRTELGRIGELISSSGEKKTPLEERLEGFGSKVLWGCLAISVLLFAWGMWKGGRGWPELLLEAVSFAVAAIPEGLPAITTITLALGTQRMARHGAVVRRLLAVETLGSASVICTDKTGTLTQNQMTVREVFAGGVRYRVTGEGYDPTGRFIVEQDGEELASPGRPLDLLLATAALCNSARIEEDRESRTWRAIGDPTEAALLALAAKGGRPRESIAPSVRFVRELPFDSDRKRMTVVTLDAGGRAVAHVKGGLDVLLPLTTSIQDMGGPRPISAEDRALVEAEAHRMSGAGLRVLAIARRVRPEEGGDPEQELTLLGIVGMYDPPRSGVKEAIAACREAGIRVVMITGDHPRTAETIARELGLWGKDDASVTGSELNAMTDEVLVARADKLRVFARTTAEQKLRIVRAYRSLGHVVAMTGDGVNDAPALKEADIGVAMGRAGTEVARQAADLVLADDNFSTVVEAVRQGRSIYRNIQKFIFFLLSSNAGLAVFVFVASFFRGALSLTPLQILWINLVTNGLPALALGVDPPAAGEMREPPRPVRCGLLGTRDLLGILYVGAVMGGFGILLFFIRLPGHLTEELAFRRAMAFSFLALSPLFHAFNCRSPRESIVSMRPRVYGALIGACVAAAAVHLVSVAIPTLRPVFRTFPMTAREWALVVALSAVIVPAVELAKGMWRMLSFRQLISMVVAFAALLSAGAARADGVVVRMDQVKPGEIRVDGIPKEWPSAMTDLGRAAVGSSRSDLGMRGAIAYDETNLYVSGEIKDPRIVHGPGCGEADDHAALLLAFPRPSGGFALHEVGLYPGEPGKSAGCVKMKGGGPIAGARIVEAPKGVPGFLTFEAAIPWRAFSEASSVRVGLRGALRYYDGDGRAVQTILSTSTDVSASELPRLPIEAEQALDEGLLREKSITLGPNADKLADIAGDGMLERVLLFGRYLVVLGPHFREGTEYYFADLAADAGAGQVPTFEVRDVNGDGKADVIVRRRVSVGDGYREVELVFSMNGGDALDPVFVHEVGIKSPSGFVSNEVRFTTEGGKPAIVVTAGTSGGYSASNYREPVETSMEPLLVPWGPVKAQVYTAAGRAFVKVRDEKQARLASTVRAESARVAREDDEGQHGALAAAARPPNADELQEQVLQLYRRERHVGKGEKPRFDLAADLAEDGRNERVLLQGRDLVVFGKGFRGGAGYAYMTLEQFADPKDIVDVTARDITNDGKAEILVRGVVHLTPPKDAGFEKGTLVDRELLLVYGVRPQGIGRVFAVETGRAIGKKRVQGAVALLPSARGVEIELRPSAAFGWTDRTYPFNQDTGKAVGGFEPLLLPWGGAPAAHYRWDGSAFVRSN